MEISRFCCNADGMTKPMDFRGATIWKGFLDRMAQDAMVADLRRVGSTAPFRHYMTPGGRKMTVKMSGAGEVAWMSERSGYGYASYQPDGASWPDIPECILNVWKAVTDVKRLPDSCLINFYGDGAKMALHQDRDETETQWPVVSISLGDDALFRLGGLSRSDRTKSIWLTSGDVAVLSGRSRLAFHGIERTKFASSTLLPSGGRLNVTLRVAR